MSSSQRGTPTLGTFAGRHGEWSEHLAAWERPARRPSGASESKVKCEGCFVGERAYEGTSVWANRTAQNKRWERKKKPPTISVPLKSWDEHQGVGCTFQPLQQALRLRDFPHQNALVSVIWGASAAVWSRPGEKRSPYLDLKPKRLLVHLLQNHNLSGKRGGKKPTVIYHFWRLLNHLRHRADDSEQFQLDLKSQKKKSREGKGMWLNADRTAILELTGPRGVTAMARFH